VTFRLASSCVIVGSIRSSVSPDPSLERIDFEIERSAAFRKVGEVLAYRSEHSFSFDKPWGEQRMPAGSWIVIPLPNGAPGSDVYGCQADVFRETYCESSSGRPHAYQKIAQVRAYQPGHAFFVKTIVKGSVEVERNTGSSTDWLVRNPGGELYTIAHAVFVVTYELVPEG
jgi:hypothetical protein